MDVRCERCRAQYLFDDDQVTPTGLTVQCTNCGYVFRVKKKELIVTVPVNPDELQGTPLPATAVAPRAAVPVYPRAPPPPSGFPPPSFMTPPPPVSPPPPAPARAPVHEVDLGLDEEPGRPKRGRGRVWALALVLAVSAAAAVYVNLPRLLARARPAPVAPPPVAQTQPEAKPEPPPEPPPPPLPVAAPEPVTEPALQAPPATVPIEKPKPAPRGPKAILAQAYRLLEKGDARAALELFGRVAADDPENADALTGRGLCYLDLENYAPAEASFEAALRIDPDQPDALLGLAETCRSRGKKSEAVSHYEKYLARHPDGEEAEVARNALAELRK